MSVNSPYQTFKDIRDAVIIDSKAGSTLNSALQTQVNRFINEAYQDIITRRKREWLDEDYYFPVDPKQEGTCSVTKDSTTVTFDSSVTLNSTSGYFYNLYVQTTEEVLPVASIAGQTVTLESEYQGETNNSATGVIVQSGLTLPEEIKTVYQVDHDKSGALVNLRGVLDFKERAQRQPQLTAPAQMATVTGVSSSSEKLLFFYPHPGTQNYTLKVHGSKYFNELVNDDDEPLIPSEYRQMLYHYAISRVYATISRNETLFSEAAKRYQLWLARLDTEIKPAQDEPSLVYDRTFRFINPFRRFRNRNRFPVPEEFQD